jgi:hypothetical protein
VKKAYETYVIVYIIIRTMQAERKKRGKGQTKHLFYSRLGYLLNFIYIYSIQSILYEHQVLYILVTHCLNSLGLIVNVNILIIIGWRP